MPERRDITFTSLGGRALMPVVPHLPLRGCRVALHPHASARLQAVGVWVLVCMIFPSMHRSFMRAHTDHVPTWSVNFMLLFINLFFLTFSTFFSSSITLPPPLPLPSFSLSPSRLRSCSAGKYCMWGFSAGSHGYNEINIPKCAGPPCSR